MRNLTRNTFCFQESLNPLTCTVAKKNGCDFLAVSDFASPSDADREHLDKIGHKALAEAIYNKLTSKKL